MTKFIFNEHHVCTNPEIVVHIEGDLHEYYEIKVACNKDDKWFMGFRMSGGNCLGSSSPCSYSELDSFSTKDEAINDAARRLKANALLSLKKETDINNSNNHKKLARKFLEWESKRTQLTLF